MSKFAFDETGGAAQGELLSQARKMLDRISTVQEELSKKDLNFVTGLADRLDGGELTVSMRQIYWLRDIIERTNA